jgi:hypothetical protein
VSKKICRIFYPLFDDSFGFLLQGKLLQLLLKDPLKFRLHQVSHIIPATCFLGTDLQSPSFWILFMAIMLKWMQVLSLQKTLAHTLHRASVRIPIRTYSELTSQRIVCNVLKGDATSQLTNQH